MLPVFEYDNGSKRRKINLGGSSSVPSQAAILERAKTQRTEREETRRRLDSAIRLQEWWRGLQRVWAVRREVRIAFEQDVTGITGLRCLVLLEKDEDALARWSGTLVSMDEGAIFCLANHSSGANWLILISRACYILLRSIANRPNSPNSIAHLQVINALLSIDVVSRYLGPQGLMVVEGVTRYLVERDLYGHLAKAVIGIPIEKKNTAHALPLLVPLITRPFTTLLPDSSPLYLHAFRDLLTSILTIPLLPNRFPLPSLSLLSSGLPITFLSVLASTIPTMVSSLGTESLVHMISNMLAFMPPRYSILSSASFDAYLLLMSTALRSLPSGWNFSQAKEPASTSTSTALSTNDIDPDEEAPSTLFVLTAPEAALPVLDERTIKRLTLLVNQPHLLSLLQHKDRARLAEFVLALNAAWPAKKESVLGSYIAYSAGGLLRELYRAYVRGSDIGRDHTFASVLGSAQSTSWPPLLFLVDLYTQCLLTMGDDEFFTTASATSVSVPGNPLSLDELTSFSKQLLNTAFALYWRDDQAGILDGMVSSHLLRFKWETVRVSVTRCLVAIHARDSRKPFTPPNHWLVSSQIEMSSFVEAAVFEEQQLQPVSSVPRALSKRQMAYVSPRLGILNNIPFAIPFEIRVSIFRHFVANDMVRHLREVDGSIGGSRVIRLSNPMDALDRHIRRYIRGTRATVRRGMIAQDGFDKLSDADLKGTVEITFVDQFGQEEAGIDGGGVFKEFLTSLCKEVFDTNHGLWLANKKNELYPNPHSYATEPHSLNWYRFIGRILGKALYEGILVDVAFAGFFLAKWLRRQSVLDDLASLDPDLYQGLIFLKHYVGNPDDLSLNFTVAVEEFGVAETHDLIPGGSNIPVTKENRLLYIHLMSRYRLSHQIKRQSEAFFEGLSEMINPDWLRMFNQQELQILLGGVNSPIDLQDLRQHTMYSGIYDDNEPTIQAFWKVVESFDHDQRRALLRFVTSCSRPPLLGFKELVPKFAIRDAGRDEHRLPTSSTCVNLLKLPQYSNEAVLRSKLLQAINSNAGFDLS